MPTIYEDPDSFGLKLIGMIEEEHIYEAVFCHKWRIAAWQDTFQENVVLYARESNFGKKYLNPPFAWLTHGSQLFIVQTADDFERFRHELEFYWRGKVPPGMMDGYERLLRNRRRRLQGKVGRIVFDKN